MSSSGAGVLEGEMVFEGMGVSLGKRVRVGNKVDVWLFLTTKSDPCVPTASGLHPATKMVRVTEMNIVNVFMVVPLHFVVLENLTLVLMKIQTVSI